jgi:hypothetical protein
MQASSSSAFSLEEKLQSQLNIAGWRDPARPLSKRRIGNRGSDVGSDDLLRFLRQI